MTFMVDWPQRQQIHAIETVYNGYRFRSRLEARWAVFFDTLGIPYIYEPEGYEFNGVKYLPDFYLPESDQFFEVKGVLSGKDLEKCREFGRSIKKDVILGFDNVVFEFAYNHNDWEPEFSNDNAVLEQCRDCGKHYFYSEDGAWACRCCGSCDGDHHLGGLMYHPGHPGYEDHISSKAVSAFKQARFEHGESPGGR